jgi:NADH-quinone oxidoreductase subunit L
MTCPWIALVPAFPLLGFTVIGLLVRRIPEKLAGFLATALVFASFAVSVSLFLTLNGLPPEARRLTQNLFSWIAVGDFRTSVSFAVDPLSSVMLLVVTGVGALIHLYSIGYMHGDGGVRRYFAYLNLFTFSMLVLVLADNLLLLFVGWEGVGLCSYLLIGFWYEKESAADAGMKAFLVNRIGDAGFLLGTILVFLALGTLDFQRIPEAARALLVPGGLTVTAITLLLFVGATGKSAQIPLFVWLPDAMEGPTPVSALIHAATMVTAGVYLVARLAGLFAMAPLTLLVIAIVGAATAFFAATIGLVQNDIKRVLAYSTVSQLGYMFLALGLGAFASGIFHLVTHAFFKALLFLAAGSVIHALSGEQDLRRMGGLRSRIPFTHAVFLVGALALAGIPPFAGFFSKDEILAAAFGGTHRLGPGALLFWAVGLAGAVLTAFYIWRLLALAFYTPPREAVRDAHHIHDAPPAMAASLGALALLSTVGGFLGFALLPGGSPFGRFLAPVFEGPGGEHHLPRGTEFALIAVSVAAALAGLLFARSLYAGGPERARAFGARFPGLYRLLHGKYFVDEIYRATVVTPVVEGSKVLAKHVDLGIVDRIVNGTAVFVKVAAGLLRQIQSGRAPEYATSLLIGAVLVVGWFLFH